MAHIACLVYSGPFVDEWTDHFQVAFIGFPNQSAPAILQGKAENMGSKKVWFGITNGVFVKICAQRRNICLWEYLYVWRDYEPTLLQSLLTRACGAAPHLTWLGCFLWPVAKLGPSKNKIWEHQFEILTNVAKERWKGMYKTTIFTHLLAL